MIDNNRRITLALIPQKVAARLNNTTMKKAFVLLLLAVFTLLVAGCSNEHPNLVNSPDDVHDRVIGALAGTPSFRLADELGTAVSFSSPNEMMNSLRAGDLDCVIMESVTASELVAETSGVRILSESIMEYDMRFAVPRENAELLAAVNSALESLHQNGTLRGLQNKYFSGRNFTYVPPEGLERSGYLSLALPPDSPPFSFRNDEGAFVGMDVEVAIAVSDQLGVELRVIEHDVWDLINAVWHGRADLALGWLPGEGDDLISISEPYAHAVHVVIVRR